MGGCALQVSTVPSPEEPCDSGGGLQDSMWKGLCTPVNCPHRNREIGISAGELSDHAFLLRTQCEKCGKEFLIVEGVPMTDEQYSSHPHPRKRY